MKPRSNAMRTRAATRASAAALSDIEEASSTDRVVKHITASILAGRYVPGQRLVEADLTRILKVSRGPVREAFRLLGAMGVLSRTMHRGACVRTLTRTEAIDLMTAIEGLDALTARLAATAVKAHRGGSKMAELQQSLRPYRDKEFDLTGSPELRQRFYDILMALTGNSQLPSVFPTMRVHLLRLQTQSYRDADERRSDAEDFAAVAKAVLSGDPAEAQRASNLHHLRVLRALIEMPEGAFAVPDAG